MTMGYKTSTMASVKIDGVVQESNVTKVDFSTPKKLTVFAENGVDFTDYTVTVQVAKFTSYTITSMSDIPTAFDTDSINHLVFSGANITDEVLKETAQRIGNTLKIAGSIRLENTNATSVEGLIDVLNCQCGYEFVNNMKITDAGLAPFKNITHVYGDFIMDKMKSDTYINACFVNIQRIEGSFRLLNVCLDPNVCKSLTYVGGDFDIEHALGNWHWSLGGFSKLTHIGGNLILNDNSVLGSFAGLDKVTYIGGNVTITKNAYDNVGDMWIANRWKLINRFIRDGVIQKNAIITITDDQDKPLDYASYGY